MDRYEVHDEIASGGMASVHLGRAIGDAGFARTIAVKRLYPQFAKDPAFVSMLTDEARLASRIHHPNVVATLDVFARDGSLSLVMEYVVGESLAALMGSLRRKRRRVPSGVAVSIFSGVLAGLHAAHVARSEDDEALDIVHRDVSPQNILVGVDGIARLIDFGIAKARVRAQATRDGVLKGKLRYLAPEQIEDGVATRRSDVYATGIVMWEALTGERPFEAETEGAMVAKILDTPLEPIGNYVDDVPPALDAVVMRAVSKDPEARFQSALEMQAAIERAMPGDTAREVGGWVRELAAGPLERRAALVREIERGERAKAAIPYAVKASVTTETFVRPQREVVPAPVTSPAVEASVTPRSRVGLIVAGFGAVALFGSVAIAVKAGVGREASASGAEPVSESRSAAVPALSSVQMREGGERLSAPAPPSAPSTTGVISAAPPVTKPKNIPAAVPKKAACDPPYFIDGNGIQRVKRECL